MSARLGDDEVARTRAFWMANRPGETAAPGYALEPPLWWHVALALVAALLVQSTWAPFLAVHGATISFVTLLVAWYGARAGIARGLAFGAIAGACVDSLAGGTGAAWTIATALAGACAGRLAGTWLADTTFVLVPGVALLGLVRFIAFGIVMQIEGRPLALVGSHMQAALWQAALDAAIALVLLRFVPAIGGVPAHRR